VPAGRSWNLGCLLLLGLLFGHPIDLNVIPAAPGQQTAADQQKSTLAGGISEEADPRNPVN